MSIRLETPGFSGERSISRPESVTALLSFLTIASGSSSTYTVPCSEPPVVDILLVGSCRSMIRAPISGMRCSGTTSTSSPPPKRALKRRRDVAHQLEVLALVLADGHLVGAVGEHVGGLRTG